MILVLASPEDVCARETVAQLKQSGHETWVVSEAELHGALQVRWDLGNDAEDKPRTTRNAIPTLPFAPSRLRVSLSSGVWQGALDEITGGLVRLRRSFLANLAEDDDAHYIQAEWAAMLFGFLNALPCPVVNRPRPGAGQRLPESRMVAEALRNSGLYAPRTLVTASAPAAAEFFERNRRRAICTSPGLGRGVLLEGDRGRQALPAASDRSIRLQAVREGHWLRVFVVGGEVFAGPQTWHGLPACGPFDSERRAQAGSPCHVLAARSLDLAESLNLLFVELLVLCGEDGRHFVFSVNDFPGIDRCEAPLRARIVKALADLLGRATP